MWHPTRPPAESAPEKRWYGPLDDALSVRVAPPRALTRAGHYLAVLDPHHTNTVERVLAVAPEAVTYQLVPLARFEGNSVSAQLMMSVEGVVAVVPELQGSDATETLVQGFDDLMAVELYQRVSQAGASDVVGGITATGGGGYPTIQYETPPKLIPDGAARQATAPALMPVLNFSVGPSSPSYATRTDDPVNLATLAASVEQLIVVAAGNDGEAQEETMSAWAQVPWVFSVGGTADSEGTELAVRSSRGTADDTASGPDVVAYGASMLDESKTGTSFAAPRVARLGLVAAAAVLQLRRVWLRAIGKSAPGVQLVGCGFVDCGFDNFRVWHIDAKALPVMGLDETAVADAVDIAAKAGVDLQVRGGPLLLRRMLLAAARPMRGYAPYQTGAGFLSDAVFLGWLASLTGVDLVTLFATDTSSLERTEELKQRALFDREQLQVFLDTVIATSPIWAYNYETRALGRVPHIYGA